RGRHAANRRAEHGRGLRRDQLENRIRDGLPDPAGLGHGQHRCRRMGGATGARTPRQSAALGLAGGAGAAGHRFHPGHYQRRRHRADGADGNQRRAGGWRQPDRVRADRCAVRVQQLRQRLQSGAVHGQRPGRLPWRRPAQDRRAADRALHRRGTGCRQSDVLMSSDDSTAPARQRSPQAAPDRIDWQRAFICSLSAFLVSRLLILLAAVLVTGTDSAPQPPLPGDRHIITGSAERLGTALDRLVTQGDAGWYHGIATDGYAQRPFDDSRQENWAFFPLHPLLWRGVSAIIGDSTAATLLWSNLLALLALFAVHLAARSSG